MTDGSYDADELTTIRTCFVRTADDDEIAVFVIDGRDYTDPAEVRRAYDEAWDEMDRRGGWEWETVWADPDEPRSTLPTWEEFKRTVDDEYPVREGR
jgi:hypothetical protein